MTIKRTVWALTLTGAFAMPAGTVRAQSGEGAAGREQLTDRTTSQDQLLGARGHKEGPHQVEGSWMVTVSPVAPPGSSTRF